MPQGPGFWLWVEVVEDAREPLRSKLLRALKKCYWSFGKLAWWVPLPFDCGDFRILRIKGLGENQYHA